MNKLYHLIGHDCSHYENGIRLKGPCEELQDSRGFKLAQNCDLACDKGDNFHKEKKEIEVTDLPLYLYMCCKYPLFDKYLKGNMPC